MANDLTFTQAATVLNSIVAQATGKSVITPTNTSEFVSVAQTALKTGYDPIVNSISQVLSKTVFSNRPYSAKFKGLEASPTRWGAHVRKLSVADKTFDEDEGYKYPVGYDAAETDPYGNGKAVDQQIIKKPEILQTNFYGQSVFQDHITMFDEQLDVAFRGPEEFAQFISMTMNNMSDRIEQAKENMARATVSNFIGGIIDEGQTDRVIHLLTEYNAVTGLSLTAQTVYQPENFPAFIKWAYARIAAISSLMTERSEMFQTVINDKHVIRHTPEANQKVYLYAPSKFQIESQVLADTYHDNYLKLADHERVNFWQSIETPDSISVKPSYVGTTGQVVVPSDEIEQAGIFGVIFDEEAMGFTTVNQKSAPSPYNARGRYRNIWMSAQLKNWNDHTEKGVVLLLD